MPLKPRERDDAPAAQTIFSPQHLSTTLGMFILVFLVAFESMAVTTVN
ncbi:hypothetical protein [Glutamicibacter sp.]|nr:hypothetical protein [Glutamicibacter sp.]